MAKLTADSVLDAALDNISGRTSPVLHVCSGTPTDRASVLTNSLASHNMSSGDFTKADAGGGGRQSTVAAQTGISITTSGTATHVAYIDGTELVYQTTCTSTALTSGGTVDVGAHVISIGDPT